jgi:Ca-activated chloride channel family protein
VKTAEILRHLREAQGGDTGRSVAFRKALGRRFITHRGLWVDESFTDGLAVTSVRFGSAAYFRLIERRPEIVEALKLGTAVLIVTAPGQALVVGETGEQELSDGQIDGLFKAVAW